MNPVPENQEALLATALVRRLQAAGHQALWAGGAVRDMLLGKEPHDIDIATSAQPDEVQRLFPRHVAVGKAFGVIRVRWENTEVAFDVATFRAEADYRDGRHPEQIAFADAEADALRRDFTINGIFYDPIHERVLDFVRGREDLNARVIRAIGDPRARFEEDALRLLRAARFASVLGFDIEPATRAAIQERAGGLVRVSAERIREELTRLWMESPRAGQGLLLLRALGLLKPILPEVEALAGVEQPPQFHPEGDVLTHTVLMLDHLPAERTPALVWAVLLHDIGKPPTAAQTREVDGSLRWRFNRHAEVGAEMAAAVLRRLKASNELVETVHTVVARHMHFKNVREMRPARLRRLIGAATFDLELALHRLDCAHSHGLMTNVDFLGEYRRKLDNEPVLPQPWITGADVMALGVPEGRSVGVWLKRAYDLQLEGAVPTREALLAWLCKELGEI